MNSLDQEIVPNERGTIRIRRYNRRLAGNAVRDLFESLPKDTNQSAAVGVSMSQDEEGIVEFIAFATTDIVFLIDTSGSEGWGVGSNAAPKSASAFPFENTFKRLLAAPNANSPFLASFDMPRVALRLFAHLGHHVRGIDLSTFRSSSDTETLLPGKALSDRFQEIDQFKVNRLWHENSESEGNLCLRAWLSAKLAEACSSQIQEAKKVDTRHVRKDILPCFAELLKQTDILAKALPRQMISEYDNFTETVSSSYQLTNSRYKTRVRKSAQSKVIVTDEQGREHQGRASGVRGKKTSIKFDSGQQQPTGPIRNIRVIGLDEPTNAEKARKLVLLKALRGDVNLIDCDFIRFLWFPTPDDLNDSRMLSKEVGYEDEHYQPQIDPFTSNLNDSQREVVKAMISCQPMIIVHGPPGTGKTTTISSAARYWSSHDQPVWIIGHSNVSVKNIAEKLWKEDTHFKLIVSKEFYVEWHEHIYEGIVKNVIQGDEMPTDPGDMKNVLEGAKIVLSTLGMLSSPVLDRNRTFSLVPVERLIVDEASQINTFEYLAVFHKFHRTLKKVCFFGDPKQLPPFGQDKAQSLKCIFDVEHLQNKSYFLDTQYRMPIPLGKFISTSVYSGGLKSEHQIDDLSCVSFVNVQFGLEWKTGTSWTNLAEIGCISNLVRHYYGSKNFCIITPYDGQRSAIESVLKAEGLPWDRVFNVDSFQGNEADYVLVSVVRTAKVGFLSLLQRLNVMLTRCRAGMVIVSNKHFLENVGHQTLVGRMASYWKNEARKLKCSSWVTSADITNQSVHLPGVPGRNVRVVLPSLVTETRPSVVSFAPLFQLRPWWINQHPDANTLPRQEDPAYDTIFPALPVQPKPIQSKPFQSKPFQSKLTQSKPTKFKPTKSNPTKSKTTQPKTTQPKNTQPKTAQSEPVQPGHIQPMSIQSYQNVSPEPKPTSEPKIQEDHGTPQSSFVSSLEEVSEPTRLSSLVPTGDGPLVFRLKTQTSGTGAVSGVTSTTASEPKSVGRKAQRTTTNGNQSNKKKRRL